MDKKKVLYVTHEMTPYLQMTEMADASRDLPQFMQEQGHEVRVFMPRFGAIKERKHRLHEVIRLSGINVPVGEDDNPLIIKVASLPSAKMQIYFLDNEDFFHKRETFWDENNKFYADNDERMIFFNKGVIEIIMKLGWIPDIIHCLGWMSSLVPLYVRTLHKNESVFKNTKIIYSVLGDSFDGHLGNSFVDKAILPGQARESFKSLENANCNELYKSGITFADGITFGNTGIDVAVSEHINNQEKPVLAYQTLEAPNFVENHYEFYHNLFEQGVLEAGK